MVSKQHNVYIEHALKLAETIPDYTQNGVILTSVFGQFKHHIFYNSLLKLKHSLPNSQAEKSQISIPRVRKTIIKSSLTQPIYDGTTDFLVKGNKNASFSTFPLSMTYLFRSIKKSKIILVIDGNSTKQSMLIKVKDTLFRFVESINKKNYKQVVKGVGIMVIDSQFQMTPQQFQAIRNQSQKNQPTGVEVCCSRIARLSKNPISHPEREIVENLLMQIIKNKKISFCRDKRNVTDLQRQAFQLMCTKLNAFSTQNKTIYQQNLTEKQKEQYGFMAQMWITLETIFKEKMIRRLINQFQFIVNPRTKIETEKKILSELQKSLESQVGTPDGMMQIFRNANQFMASKIQEDKPTRNTQRLIRFYLKMKNIYRKIDDKQVYKEFITAFCRLEYICDKRLNKILSSLFVLSDKMKPEFQVTFLNNSIMNQFFPDRLDFLMKEIEKYLDDQISKFQVKKKSQIVDHLANILQQFIKKLEQDPQVSKRLLATMKRRRVLIKLQQTKGLSGNKALIQLIQCEKLSRQCGLFENPQHYRRIYERIGDCLVFLEKYDKAILFYQQGNSFWKIQTAFEKKLHLRQLFEFRFTKFRASQFQLCILWMVKLGLEQQSRKLCYMCLEVFYDEEQQEMFKKLLNRTRRAKQEHLVFLSEFIKNIDPKISEDELDPIKSHAEVDLANEL